VAFWSNWFKTPCEECGNKFDKDALLSFEERRVCSDCHDSILDERRTKEEERAKRVAEEEAARQALLDRPMR